MLVAENQEEVYYPQQGVGAALPKEQLREIPKQQPKGKVKTQTRARSKPKGKLMPMFLLITIFSLSCLAITRYVTINQNHQEIMELENTLRREQSRHQKLRIELAERGSLDRIEKIAREELGMDYPTKDQVQSVSLPDKGINTTVKVEGSQPSTNRLLKYITDIFNR